MLITLFIVTTFSITCDKLIPRNSYSVEDAFQCVNSIETSVDYNTKFVTLIKTIFDNYVYKDILKNPPQPSFNSSYYNIVDIDQRLNDINLEETKLYSFYQQTKQIYFEAHDLHLSLTLRSNANYSYIFDSFYYYLPFKIHIESDKKVFLIPNKVNFNVTLPNIFIDYENIQVVSINNDSPLNFIRNYAESYTALKSPHARFTYALENLHFGSLTSNPLKETMLSSPITIEWSDGNKTTLTYQLIYSPKTSISEKSQRNILLKNKIVSPLNSEDIDDSIQFKMTDSIFDLKSFDGNVACKTFSQETRKINVLVLKQFVSFVEPDSFYDTFEKCIQQFDTNNYPISLILPMNSGGYPDLESNLENVLAPHADTSFIASVRISKGTENCLRSGLYPVTFSDLYNCSTRSNETVLLSSPPEEWYSNPIIDKYGNVEHKRSQPSLIPPRIQLSSRLVKNPRKPQEIVVFTDGFCYSSCSMLTKGLREKGNAIIVGFEGDPELDDSLFDVGQSPTFTIADVDTLLEEGFELNELGASMQISYMELYRFKYDYNETIPREFLIDPINERVNIYRYEETNINSFADEALRIIKKYETECDSNNKRLVKVDGSCDNKITIEHAHGGYVCGDDNKWTTTCVASYCDNGYKFDYENQKCIEDVCFPPKEDKSEGDQWNIWIIIGFSIGSIIIFVILLLSGLAFIIVHSKKLKLKYESLE